MSDARKIDTIRREAHQNVLLQILSDIETLQRATEGDSDFLRGHAEALDACKKQMEAYLEAGPSNFRSRND